MNFEKYEREVISTLQELIKINSIRNIEQASVQQAFGPGIDQCMDKFLEFANSFGLRTFKDPNGKYAYAEIGPENQPIIGILGHMDTVDIGDEKQWTLAGPFSGKIVDDKIIGRGSLDDKGPIVVNLIALKALIDSGYDFKHRVRIIIGGAEETTWEGINAYKACEELPTIAYTPDADFPLINGEQAILQFRLKTKGEQDIKITTNNSINAVCDYLEYEGNNISNLQKELSNSHIEGSKLIVEGKSAHAMECFKGVSAINKLLLLLNHDNNLIAFLKAFCLDVHGASLFPTITNEHMTLNIGNLNINPELSMAEIDMRLPLGCDVNFVKKEIQDLAKKMNLDYEEIKFQPELFVSVDSPLVQTLLSVYCEIMDKQPKPLTTGGGTYARALDNCVAFGMVFKEEHMLDLMHQPNECLEIKFIKPALAIYTKAIQALDKLDL